MLRYFVERRSNRRVEAGEAQCVVAMAHPVVDSVWKQNKNNAKN